MFGIYKTNSVEKLSGRPWHVAAQTQQQAYFPFVANLLKASRLTDNTRPVRVGNDNPTVNPPDKS